MKKFFSLMFAVCGLMLLVGCSDSPKDVAIKWAEAINDGDVEEANEYSTERTHKINALLIGRVKEGKEVFDIDKLEDGKEKIDEDGAELDAGTTVIPLKKVDGDWKVDVQK